MAEAGAEHGPITAFACFCQFTDVAMQGHLQLRPMLKMEGAQPDGSDLLLAANVSADRRSLVALTPASQKPLSAGDHPLKLSLNGQFSEMKRPDIVSSRKQEFVMSVLVIRQWRCHALGPRAGTHLKVFCMTLLVTLLDGGMFRGLVHVSVLRTFSMGSDQKISETQSSHALLV